MKKYLVFPMLFVLNLAYAQQVDLINENFDDGLPVSWKNCSTNWGNFPSWTADSGVLKESSGHYFVGVLNAIQLPAVDLRLVSTPFLEFDLAMAEIDTNIQLSVWYTTDTTCTRGWDTITERYVMDGWTLLSSYGTTAKAVDKKWTPQSTDYQTITIDLTPFTNDSNIRFCLASDYNNYFANGVWYLDNVTVFGNSTSGIFEPSESASFELFPNPSHGVVHFVPSKHIENATLKIIDITGSLVLMKKIDSLINEIDVLTYGSGIYFVHYIYENNTAIKKLIIQ
jgi:hypothetical protein